VELTPKQGEFLDEQRQFVKKHNIGLPEEKIVRIVLDNNFDETAI